MRLICFWCFLLAAVVRAQNNDYYAPQTFRQPQVESYQRALFKPARNDVTPQSTVAEPWRPAPVNEQWREPGPNSPPLPKNEPWRLPFGLTKEQHAAILHHKQSLSSDGAFRFEYASDNGLAAGEVIQPDGTRLGAYQYKDPNGQLVKLKYKAGKDGFQILEGSHIPKSPEPVPPNSGDNHYQNAYAQQRQQYDLQQYYNQQKPEPIQNWRHTQVEHGSSPHDNRPAGRYFVENWKPQAAGEDDGQYRENEVETIGQNKPHNFGEGYAFAFQG